MAQAPVGGRMGGPGPQAPAPDLVVDIAPDDQQEETTVSLDTSDEQQKVDDHGIPAWYTNFVKPITEGAADVTASALEGATNTVVSTARAFGRLPGVRQINDALYGKGNADAATSQMQEELNHPRSVLGKVGYYGEQIAELAAPLPKGTGIAKLDAAAGKAMTAASKVAPRAAKLGAEMATEGVRSAAQGEMQGYDPTTAGEYGILAPLVGAGVKKFVKPVATYLAESAEKRAHQALGPTKERFKAMAERLVPEMLRRGIGKGMSREAMLELASDNAEAASKMVDGALQKFGTRQMDPTQVMATLENAKNAFRQIRVLSIADALKEGLIKPAKQAAGMAGQKLRYALGPNQRMLPNGMLEHIIEVDARPLRQLEGLQQVVKELGPNPTVEQLVGLRRVWDSIVDGAGGYAHRSPGSIGVPLAEQSEAWVKMKGANAIRKLLAQGVPELAAVNKEYHFWRSLNDVLSQTVKRTAPQQESLLGKIAGAGTTIVGGVVGSGAAHHMGGGVTDTLVAGGTAAAIGKLGEMFYKVTRSPAWRITSAHLRSQLADAIMANDVSAIANVLGRIAAVQASPRQAPARATPTPPPQASTGDAQQVGPYTVQMVQ